MRIAVLGVGLIGGSIGLAARTRLGAEVVGFDEESSTLEAALRLGALDSGAETILEAVESADAIFCAAPVAALPRLVGGAIAASGPEAIVTDVGSTKRGLLDAVAGIHGAHRFIGGHPLAGAETAGVEGSRADLFDGARWYLTPTALTEGVLFDRLHRLIADLGARPQAIEAATHDREMASISHLPHVLANVLVSSGAARTSGSERPPEVGRSFRDATRVAGANPSIWADIFSSNSDAVATEIDGVVARLVAAAELIRAGDPEAISRWQGEAREDRRRMLEADLAATPLHELQVSVENKPGTVAEIALALAGAGVNIEDMALFPAADAKTGAITLWIGGTAEANRAAAIVAGLGHAVAPVATPEP